MKKTLREGFTTGTAAAAGAKAAASLLLGCPDADAQSPNASSPNASSPDARFADGSTLIDVPLPKGHSADNIPDSRLRVPLHKVELRDGTATAVVIKDGGDDPDATHGAEIHVHVRRAPEEAPGSVLLRGGRGVGRITLAGLPVPPGQPAINPAPRGQIIHAVREAMELAGCFDALEVTIEVPEGERIAQKTLNPRLGIVGGISILGTRGTVKPFSHDAWKATIRQGLSVARQAGLTEIAFTTGGRSERFFREHRPQWPALGVIQAADFFRFSMELAVEFGFTTVHWSVFFGKLVKHAQKFGSTHAVDSRIDFTQLARWFAEGGVRKEACERTSQAVTAIGALEAVGDDPARDKAVREIVARAARTAHNFAQGRACVAYSLFDFNGNLLDFLELQRSNS
ncbi:MAG: cobalt-precorrin-5B (C(1))-methyltransferase CbiD [Desulfovibrio sp.]|uniref:cobalt-precorrin-5B (C(1))-methyltransferase CbiD n=1 Tax=Desulfovibrio sp. 7SRBS1 TaxID=3378064 RepID=UPI003B3D4B7E